ncbi:hypothetical protein BaRGS_00024626 [Batillaria attramentaria]|uniref:Uncharacterized protein n=1 Tax=Batillaria attramentaria TaxID=370345 RepID=A0ABD0KAP7_9CAEN
MQIYLSENQEFRKFVQAHMDFLGKIVDVESLDCNLARNYKNPDGWMKSMIAKHHVLIYLSPTLGERLKKIEENPHSEDHGTTHLNLCGKAVERLRKRSHRSLCFRGLRTRAAFVVSGCFNTDQEHSAYLSRQRWFGVPCFRVMSEDVRSLESPRELVQVLCGGRKGVTCRTFDWANTAQADKLRHQAYQLKVHLDEVRVHAERSADRGMNNEHPLHMNPAGHGMYDAHLLHMNPVGRGMNDEHVLHMNPADRGMNDGHVLHRNLAGLGMNNEHLPHWNPAGRGMNNGHPPYVDPAGRRMNQEHLFHINPAGRGMNDEYLPHMNPAGRGMNDEHLPRMNLVGRGVNNEHQPRTDVNERCMPSEMNASGDKEQVRGLLSNGYAAGVQCTEPPGGTGTDSGFSSDPRSNSNRIASNDPRGRFNVQPRPCADEESSAERDALIGRHTAGACNSSNPSPPSFFGPDDGASEISSRSGMSECFRRVNDRSGWHRPP